MSVGQLVTDGTPDGKILVEGLAVGVMDGYSLGDIDIDG